MALMKKKERDLINLVITMMRKMREINPTKNLKELLKHDIKIGLLILQKMRTKNLVNYLHGYF